MTKSVIGSRLLRYDHLNRFGLSPSQAKMQLGTIASFRMLLAKVGTKIYCCCQLASHTTI